jgi:hypothetical protein
MKIRKKKPILWFGFVLLFAFIVAFVIGFLSELFDADSILICVAIIVLLLAFAAGCDIIAMATMHEETSAFNAMASRRIRGAKICIRLVQHKDKVGSIMSDIVGDICATINGAVGASIAFLVTSAHGYATIINVLIFVLIMAVIASASVTIKAIVKYLGIAHSTKIVFFAGRVLSYVLPKKYR